MREVGKNPIPENVKNDVALVYHFDWGVLPVPPHIQSAAEMAPKRSYVVNDRPGVEPFRRYEPDCPELDAWVAERNAAFARGEIF